MFTRLLAAPLTTRTLRRGQHLYWPRDARAYVYSIHRGTLKTYRPAHDCGERISGFHFPGELLGLDALFGVPARRGAIALQSATVLMVPVAMLLEYLDRSALIRLELLAHFNDEIIRLEEHLCLDRLTAEERLATFVLWAAEKMSVPAAQPTVCLPMSQKDIGNYLGLVPETVSRLFARFERRRWLSMNRRTMTVQNLHDLKQAATGRHGTPRDDVPLRQMRTPDWNDRPDQNSPAREAETGILSRY